MTYKQNFRFNYLNTRTANIKQENRTDTNSEIKYRNLMYDYYLNQYG